MTPSETLAPIGKFSRSDRAQVTKPATARNMPHLGRFRGVLQRLGYEVRSRT